MPDAWRIHFRRLEFVIVLPQNNYFDRHIPKCDGICVSNPIVCKTKAKAHFTREKKERVIEWATAAESKSWNHFAKV